MGEIELGADGGRKIGFFLFVSAHQGLHLKGALYDMRIVG
jgi:hypothetical protein